MLFVAERRRRRRLSSAIRVERAPRAEQLTRIARAAVLRRREGTCSSSVGEETPHWSVTDPSASASNLREASAASCRIIVRSPSSESSRTDNRSLL
jgi:hypothetical protein